VVTDLVEFGRTDGCPIWLGGMVAFKFLPY
jgi:hypothetical protein